MLLLDVNVLVYAFRQAAPDHERLCVWLEDLPRRHDPFGVPDIVWSGFLRIVTHPRIFSPPTRTNDALDFVTSIRAKSANISPGPRHWDIFIQLCRTTGAKGNDVPDAYLAALAIEHGFEWITTDRGFARFPGLRWRHPLD